MSNLIPYFVLAVVALGFFAVCYAVFSGGDGESKAKEKSYKNISNKNNPKAHNDVIFATESQEGNVTITHTSGTNVYTASIPDTVETVVGEEREPAESLVDPIDTSYNRRSTLKSNSSHVSEGEYALALGSDNGTPIGDETIVMIAVSDLKLIKVLLRWWIKLLSSMLLQMNFSITQTLLKIQLLWVNLWKPLKLMKRIA